MTEIYRIGGEMMKTLEMYMDSEIREEVRYRFSPCTNEEFLAEVFLREGISVEAIEEVLNIDFEEFEATFMLIEKIKDHMHCNNVVNSKKMLYPDRELYAENGVDGREYRLCLDMFFESLDNLKTEFPEMRLLSDLRVAFPEIGRVIVSGHFFYTWMNAIVF